MQPRHQQQVVVGSILQLFADAVARTRARRGRASTPTYIAEIAELVDGRAVLDAAPGARSNRTGRYDEVDSGQWPADRLDDHRANH